MKGKAIKEYAGDWIAFFVDWEQKGAERHQEALKQAVERHQEALKQAVDNKEQVIQVVVKQKKEINKQNKQLRQQLALITKKVTALEKDMLRKAQAERGYKEKRDRRKGRERRPSRAAATYVEYQEALNSVGYLLSQPENECVFFSYILQELGFLTP